MALGGGGGGISFRDLHFRVWAERTRFWGEHFVAELHEATVLQLSDPKRSKPAEGLPGNSHDKDMM